MNDETVRVGNLRAVVGPPAASPRRAAKVGGPAPEWIEIFPAGDYTYDWEGKAETALCDAESRALVIAAFEARGNDLVVDYEHQTLDGDQAPAAGWITALEDRGDAGLWARVEWTEKAKAYLETGEYRYDSPVFTVDRETRRVVKLHHIALTNWPASHNRTALTEQIAAKARAMYEPRTATAREGGMTLLEQLKERITWWLNLSTATATNKEAREGLLKLAELFPDNEELMVASKAEGEDVTFASMLGVLFGAAPVAATPATETIVANKAVLDELELPETATLAQVHAKIGELRMPSDMVAAPAHAAVVSERDALKTKVAELEATTEEEKLNQLIVANRTKITPAKEPWFRALAKKHGIAHASEVARELKVELPEVPADVTKPIVEPEVRATTDDGRPVDERGALRRAKVERYMAEKNIDSYDEANERLRKEERAAAAS